MGLLWPKEIDLYVVGSMGYAPARHDNSCVVLLVEDEEAQRWLFAAALREQGFVVLEASEGDEALRMCDGIERIDMVIADLRMPIMGGFELVDRLMLSHGVFHVLYISGCPPEDIQVQAEIMRKPFTRESLIHRVNGILRGSSQTLQ